jgi:Na+-transporting NADH:ubiquinone oxidoreductase subunit D
MGRTEGMAKNVSPWPAFLDGIGAGLGYSLVLAMIGIFRELLGFGEILGYKVIPLAWYGSSENPHGYQNILLMVSPPAAFFLIGFFIWGLNLYQARKKK